MTTHNIAWTLTYLHKTYTYLPQLAHFPIHIKNIHIIHKKPKIPTIPNFPNTAGGKLRVCKKPHLFQRRGLGRNVNIIGGYQPALQVKHLGLRNKNYKQQYGLNLPRIAKAIYSRL